MKRIYSIVFVLTIIFHLSLSFHIHQPSLRHFDFDKRPEIFSNNRQKLITKSVFSLSAIQDDVTLKKDQLIGKLKGTCVYFVGMMGSGKSTVGNLLASKLGYRFLDTDELAEYMIEMPISEFFALGKVEEFRQVEYQILMEMAQYTRLVLATGGGIVERNDNWGFLRHGIVVFLDMSPEDIYIRLSNKPEEILKRPLLNEAEPQTKLQSLHSERYERYSQSDVRIPVDPAMSPDALADMVIEKMLEFIENNPPLWQSWKRNREKIAVDAAARLNPAATAAADVGFGANKGTIKHVALSDIQSGAFKLPKSSAKNAKNEGKGDDSPPAQENKGFGSK